jgi:hypothetical protein
VGVFLFLSLVKTLSYGRFRSISGGLMDTEGIRFLAGNIAKEKGTLMISVPCFDPYKIMQDTVNHSARTPFTLYWLTSPCRIATQLSMTGVVYEAAAGIYVVGFKVQTRTRCPPALIVATIA